VSLADSFFQDLDAFLISGLWVVLVIALAEYARTKGFSAPVTRKMVHVGVGSWILPTYLLFDAWYWAALPAAAFVVINGLSWQFGWMRSVEGDRSNVGVILFPLSTALALALFWTPPWPVVGASAILVMAWGDAAAALVGRQFGRTHYEVFGHRRSLEGSVAMAAMSFVAIGAVFMTFGAPVDGGVVGAAVIVAVAASLVEAVCPWGLDNLLVPASVALVLSISHGGLWG
jgi:phytol kinase